MSKLDNYAWRYLPRCRILHALGVPGALYARCVALIQGATWS